MDTVVLRRHQQLPLVDLNPKDTAWHIEGSGAACALLNGLWYVAASNTRDDQAGQQRPLGVRRTVINAGGTPVACLGARNIRRNPIDQLAQTFDADRHARFRSSVDTRGL